MTCKVVRSGLPPLFRPQSRLEASATQVRAWCAPRIDHTSISARNSSHPFHYRKSCNGWGATCVVYFATR